MCWRCSSPTALGIADAGALGVELVDSARRLASASTGILGDRRGDPGNNWQLIALGDSHRSASSSLAHLPRGECVAGPGRNRADSEASSGPSVKNPLAAGWLVETPRATSQAPRHLAARQLPNPSTWTPPSAPIRYSRVQAEQLDDGLPDECCCAQMNDPGQGGDGYLVAQALDGLHRQT